MFQHYVSEIKSAINSRQNLSEVITSAAEYLASFGEQGYYATPATGGIFPHINYSYS